MILLKEIVLTNFLSHAKTSIEISNQQKLLIDGKSGSGKSSIVEGLVWALYGIGRSDNRSLIKRGAKSATVSVALIDSANANEYLIERSITASNKHEFKILEGSGKTFAPIKATGVRGNQEYLENIILRSSYLLFINSIIFPQNSTENFVNQTAAKRKDLILEIIKASDYDEYLKKAKEALQKENSSAEIIETKIDGFKRTIEEQREKATRLPEYESEDKLLKEQARKATEEYNVLLATQESLIKESLALDNKKTDLSTTLQTIIKNEEKLRLLNKRIIDLSSIDVNGLKTKVAPLAEKREELIKLNAIKDQENKWIMDSAELYRTAPADRDFDNQIKEINKQIMEAMQEAVEKCEKCGTPYSRMEERRQQRLKTLEIRLVESQSDKKALEEARLAHNAKLEALGPHPVVDNAKMESLRMDIKALEEVEKQLLIAQGSQTVIDETIKAIEETSQEQVALNNKKKSLEADLLDPNGIKLKEENIKKRISEHNEIKQLIASAQMENHGRLMVAQEAAQNVEKNQKEVEAITKELEAAKENKEALAAIKEAFGPNGIRAIVIDYVIPQLEDKVNNVLQKLSDFRVHLDTQKSGAGKDVVLEGLFITIINGEGEELDFANYSGGERIKVVTAISEALSEIQNIGFRVLDELFIGLDDESISGFANVMIELQERFSQMVCISHLQQIKDLFEDKIYISKVNGTSIINK